MALQSKPPVQSLVGVGQRRKARRGTQHSVRSSWRDPGYWLIPMNRLNAKGVRWSPVARLDLYAVGLSTLCVLHCVALPLLVALMPVAAQAAENELVHRVMVIVAVPVSLRVIWKTRPLNANRLFVGAASTGLALLLLAAFIEAVSSYEEPITVAGAVLLGSAHLWHWMRKCGSGGVHGLPVEPDER